tara:strand:- start:2186 stop:3478 length:1293 start_codon:yes stop_codon:yes gene_type:complete
MRKLYISCPATSRSGYGDHSRDLIRSLIAMDMFDIKILDQRWGSCSRDALSIGKDEDIYSRFVEGPMKEQPDIWVQVTVPNEFQPVGKYNIGITAGMETTMVSGEWLEGCNRMDKIIVPSEHSKRVFEFCKYDKIDKKTQQKIGELACNKSIEVLFEGLDTEVFKKTKEIPETINDMMSEIKEDFCFLLVGHWLNGDFTHDRKDIGGTIKTFVESFKAKGKNKRPALIVKTSGAGFSVKDRENIIQKIEWVIGKENKKDLPRIYFLHGDLTQEELNGLYNHNKVKAMFCLTHGEGFGRPFMEFSNTGKPTIVSNWSGHLDFLSEYGLLVGGELKNVHDSAVWENVIMKESQWFYANYNAASALIKDVYANYKKHHAKTRKQTQYIKDNFTLEKMTERFTEIMNGIVSGIPEQVKLELPKLKTPKLEKINE